MSNREERCFNIETSAPLCKDELKKLAQLLAEGFLEEKVSSRSTLKRRGKIVEIGPRLNVATSFSTNAVAICKACGFDTVRRIERSTRFIVPKQVSTERFIAEHQDRMTETVYSNKLESFKVDVRPEPVSEVRILEDGLRALRDINREMGLGMDEWDLNFYYNLFANDLKRNPTTVECFQLGQANSEHSRHWFFRGRQIIDGREKEESLMEVVKAPLKAHPSNSLIAFSDNSSAIKGFKAKTLIPTDVSEPASLKEESKTYHFVFTAETHNFPTGVAPFPGAETGGGGRIRDVQATGRGALVVAGTAGYCVGNLNIPGYKLPWENETFKYPDNLAAPLKIQIDASNGASDYGNKFGEPLIQGFNRSFGMLLPNGERQEWIKPIMFSGGIGQIDEVHVKKWRPEKGMLIIQIGGPAYRIGMGGGAASSMIQGDNKADLDFNAVQRGDAEMEQKMNRVIRACSEMGANNPIVSIHDQGAGGPCNVLTELIEPAGGRIEIRRIKLGDETLSVLEIWGAEYQERNALLIRPKDLKIFQKICQREKVECEVLGRITGDGRVVVHDENDDSYPVDLELSKILGKMPQKKFADNDREFLLAPLVIPRSLSFAKALENVLKLPSVCSKRFLTSKVDRSVTGLIARQQCCGPLDLPISDVSVIAQSHFGKTGAAISVGEQPIKMLLDPKAGARMSVGEALTNIVSARVSALEDIKCSGNWMWPAKLPGEGTRLYAAASAMKDMMIALRIAIDGGKDSLSMAAKVDTDIIKSPGELAISAYVSVPDIEKVLTPDIKQGGGSHLWFIDLGMSRCRLGGSALAQTLGQLGDECPDIENPQHLKNLFLAVQGMIDRGIALSGHDRSDGGLITTVLEMAFAGNCGLDLDIEDKHDAFAFFFNEELGYVVEVAGDKESQFKKVVKKFHLEAFTRDLGKTRQDSLIRIRHNSQQILKSENHTLRQVWEETSYRLNRLQTNPAVALQEKKNIARRSGQAYHLSFTPTVPRPKKSANRNPKVAIIREEGSNGDREMSSAFHMAGFDVWDVSMSDLLQERIQLRDFRGLAFVGGFSYADVFGSAKGWASSIRYSRKLSAMFDEFYNRPDTFSLGVCNGCQLMASIGWVPWRGMLSRKQPRLARNKSGRFESRWVSVKIQPSPAIMLQGMENSTLGIWVAHGEGQFIFPEKPLYQKVIKQHLAPLVFVDDTGRATEKYPFNPNGSMSGLAALCSPDGRHLAMMPHPERAFLKWQWPWMPEEMKNEIEASPWLKMFQNAYTWCQNNKQ
ncbi:MAG: phosphoribosylformylglycinamidine synthase [Patescibacteria group bacterium]